MSSNASPGDNSHFNQNSNAIDISQTQTESLEHTPDQNSYSSQIYGITEQTSGLKQ